MTAVFSGNLLLDEILAIQSPSEQDNPKGSEKSKRIEREAEISTGMRVD
jgi:hypothetical protein